MGGRWAWYVKHDNNKYEWDEYVNNIELLCNVGISLLCRGTPQQLIDFCYSVYDINGDKSLAREELHHCLKGSLIPYSGVLNADELEEALREVVEIVNQNLLDMSLISI